MFSVHQQISFREAVSLYKDRRLWMVFLLGCCSGFPWVLIGSALSAWLQEHGVSRTEIGLFGVVFTAYAINFLWAPILDGFRLPFTRLGRRKGWILLMLSVILTMGLILSQLDPSTSLWWIALLALIIAIASATQDIAVDAFRIDVFDETESRFLPAGSAMATSGWWTGYSLPGAVAFFVADIPGLGWPGAYLILAAITLLLLVAVLWLVTENQAEIQKENVSLQRIVHTWLDPLADFFKRYGGQLALTILVFLLLFKIGEAFLGRMSIVFYKEIGFSNSEIGTYSKIVGWWVTIFFAFAGSLINARFGIARGLILGGIAMASSNLLFSWIAEVGPDTNLFALAVLVDGFTSALATVTLVAFISSLTSRHFSATQYALMASIANLGRTIISSSSGMVVDWMDGNWTLFFIITALMVIPSLLLVNHITGRLEASKLKQ